MFGQEFNSIIIVAELARTAMGGSATLQNHVSENLHDQVSRHTITLYAGELPSQPQGTIVNCEWVNPFPEASQQVEGVIAHPHVTCEIFEDPLSGMPTLKAYVSDWPEGSASVVAFAIKNSDTAIVIANPNDPTVNLQTTCGIGLFNQFVMRSFKGFGSDPFITEEAASSACFRGINELTVITITDANGTPRQILFDPTTTIHDGNKGAFQPFRQDVNGVAYKILFDPQNPESYRTLLEMANALEAQLNIATGQNISVSPYVGFVDGTQILEHLPLPTPTAAPTEIASPTPEPTPYIAPPQAEVIEQAILAKPELMSDPLANISLELTPGSNVTIYRENPSSTDSTELAKYLTMISTTLDQQALNNQFANVISSSTLSEWFKSIIGKYKPAVEKVENQPITMSTILHINFGNPSSRTLIFDGLDSGGKFIRIILPLKHNFTVRPGNILEFKNGTSIKISATDTKGNPDEADITLARLIEQIEGYPNLGSQFRTLPEVIVVPMRVVPYLYDSSSSRNTIIAAAQALRQTEPSTKVTLAYKDKTGAQHLVPNFELPTGMVGTVVEYIVSGGVPIYKLNVSLRGDLVDGNIISQVVLDNIHAQMQSLAPGVTFGDSFYVYVVSDNIAAIPGPKINPSAPTPAPDTITPTPEILTTPTDTMIPSPTPTSTPRYRFLPPGEERQMDPRIKDLTPRGYNPFPRGDSTTIKHVSAYNNSWARTHANRSSKIRNHM